ncbi:imidazole glycerol phosphate synthase cyclase subunit [Gammaproteobacteria bacterium]|nr:imidazole glycerol phosphate synthase cyclase subunit [Gammaproteobacteria bacterium]
MANHRVIPVILLKNGRVVQSKGFKRHQVLGNPSSIVGRFSNWNADELIYLDISRDKNYDLKRDDLNFKNSSSILEIIHDFSKTSFMPLTIGGGIKTIEDVELRLAAGADKVVINTEAYNNPDFISQCAKIFGSQCIVISIDAKKMGPGLWEVFVGFGKQATGLSPEIWAKKMESMGAGEILINSIDRDGKATGFDLDLVNNVVSAVSVPVVAMGGAGAPKHFADVIDSAKPSGVAASNIFQYTENAVFEINKYLYDSKYKVRKPKIQSITYVGDN